MRKTFAIILTMAGAALLASGPTDAASRHTKKTGASSSGEAAFWGGLVPMENGVPVIMKGYHPPKSSIEPSPKSLSEQPELQRRSERPVHIPRGSSSYVDIPPVNPSARGVGPSPQETMRQGQAVQPYNPPPINSFGDRVINAIHDFPLQRGIGNNPNDLQSFIRQRANQ